MNRLSRQFAKGITGKVTRTVALSLVCIAIGACSKGEGVQLGTGQDPDPVVVDFPIAYIKSPLPTDDNGVFEQQDLRIADLAATSAIALEERVEGFQGVVVAGGGVFESAGPFVTAVGWDSSGADSSSTPPLASSAAMSTGSGAKATLP